FHGSGIDADDADIVLQASATERTREGHEGGIARAPRDVVRIETLAGGADVVDDHTVAARLHRRVDQSRQVDVAEDLQVPRPAPGCAVDGMKTPTGNVAGVVHQDVDMPGFPGEPLDVGGLAQVDGMYPDGHAARFPQASRQRMQEVLAPRSELEVGAFGGEGF